VIVPLKNPEIDDVTLGAPALVRAESGAARAAVQRATSEPPWLQWLLIGAALLFLGLFLITPLIVVFVEAFRNGFAVYRASLTDADALAAIKLTLLVAAITLPLNTLFGIAAAWSIAKFRFKGKSVLITLIDLPFAVSPVIAGLIFVLLFGRQGIFGPTLENFDWQPVFHFHTPWLNWKFAPGRLHWQDVKIIFATPGIVLATAFVTFPFVARELMAFMESQGTEEEEAAIVLGASGWQTFWRITLPNIKWGLLYGIILCNARAMGEFGAVSVVSGHIPGQTSTIPLQVEILYGEYKFAAAFALASILTLLGIVTLVIKRIVEIRAHRQLKVGSSE